MAESAAETSGFSFNEVSTKYGKWILIGGAAVVALVLWLRRGTATTVPQTGAPADTVPTDPNAALETAIDNQNKMLLGLAGQLQQSRSDMVDALTAYQKQVADLLKAQKSSGKPAPHIGFNDPPMSPPTAPVTSTKNTEERMRRQAPSTLNQEAANAPLPPDLVSSANAATAAAAAAAAIGVAAALGFSTPKPSTFIPSAKASADSTAPILAPNGVPLVRNPGAFVPGMSNADYYDHVIMGQ